VGGATTLGSTLDVVGASTFGGNVRMEDNKNFYMSGTTSTATFGGTLKVTGQTTLASNLAVTSGSTFGSTLAVGSHTTVGGVLRVASGSTFASTLAVGSASTFGNSIRVASASTFASTLRVQSRLQVDREVYRYGFLFLKMHGNSERLISTSTNYVYWNSAPFINTNIYAWSSGTAYRWQTIETGWYMVTYSVLFRSTGQAELQIYMNRNDGSGNAWSGSYAWANVDEGEAQGYNTASHTFFINSTAASQWHRLVVDVSDASGTGNYIRAEGTTLVMEKVWAA
jgi:hypothetical protein